MSLAAIAAFVSALDASQPCFYFAVMRSFKAGLTFAGTTYAMLSGADDSVSFAAQQHHFGLSNHLPCLSSQSYLGTFSISRLCDSRWVLDQEQY
jgi:hypothetical protein